MQLIYIVLAILLLLQPRLVLGLGCFMPILLIVGKLKI